MSVFLFYKKDSGKIVSRKNTRREMIGLYSQDSIDQDFIESSKNPKDHYVDVTKDPVEVKPKIQNPSYLDGTTIKSVPSPSTVTLYDGSVQSAEVTDERVDLDSDVPGTYLVVVDPADAKYYTAEFEVNL